MRKYLFVLVIGLLIFTASSVERISSVQAYAPNGTPRSTRRPPTKTPRATATSTVFQTPIPPPPTATNTSSPVIVTPTSTPSKVIVTGTLTSTPTAGTPVPGQPYPNAPLCPDSGANHPNTEFHTLWDSVRGCHYDHEHGTNPFTSQVDAKFPGFDLFALLGNVEVGHTNPSSAMENVMKHGGMKWDVMLENPHGCVGGFEDARYCISSVVIQYHNFGPYSVEMEARIHSVAALIKVCNPTLPSDCGYLYSVQHEEYGQRVTPYQGHVLPYPDTFLPTYSSPSGPYFTVDCIGDGVLFGVVCRASIADIRNNGRNSNSIWTSKPTGFGARPPSSFLVRVLFRIRDVYQVVDSSDNVYPFTFLFICSADGGVTYNSTRCRYNNSTSAIHEIGGRIPSAWDNLSGFDTNPAIGRITAVGFTDRFGNLRDDCVSAGGGCFPLKMVNMFVGFYGDFLTLGKVSNPDPSTNPERDIYFCNGVVCSETSPNAIPSGWIGPEN